MKKISLVLSMALLATAAHAKVPQSEADKLGVTLTPLGAEKAGNKDGSYPAWDGGLTVPRPAAGSERKLSSVPSVNGDKPLYTITGENMGEYKDKLSIGYQTLLKRFPSYKLNVYPTRRTTNVPDWVGAATKVNAVNAELANGGESLVNAITGTPFPIAQNALEVVWNHKTRYRGTSLRRYNTQLAVQTNGDFQPFKLREDVRFHYSFPNQKPTDLDNVLFYFLQLTMEPPRQAGSVLLVHETMDQVAEARRAWLYNPGQRRVRRAPNVAYDNPGNGSDGLRTNDQLDVFNGATDRYTWKLVGRKEMLMPYNSYVLAQDSLKYKDIAKKNHINQDLARYELRRVWVVESQLKAGTSHIYSRRTFYVDEDSWSMLQADIYDRRDALWRIQESHNIQIPWQGRTGTAMGTIYDLQSGRYLVLEASNEEPLYEDIDFNLSYFDPGNMAKVATK